jgi:FG-GAP-like repeat
VASVVMAILIGWFPWAPSFLIAEDANSPSFIEHPLLPGIRSVETHNPDWPRICHDKIATGFSPLVCGMAAAPIGWSKLEIPGRLEWVRALTVGTDYHLLVHDSALRLLTMEGKQIWSRGYTGVLHYCGPLGSDAHPRLLMGSGANLVVLDMENGATLWSHTFEPTHVDLVVRVADLLPDVPGQEAAVFLNHGEQGCVVSFLPTGVGNIVWQRTVVEPGEFDERYDHHSGIELDLSRPDQPIIWNVRRYRCRGIEARSGTVLSSLAYDIGGAQRRNYGDWKLGTGRNGRALAIVFGESVQIHVHGIRLNRSGANELAWQHYYGEVYKESPGVALEKLAIADVNGDGITDAAYSVRDPTKEYRSFVRVRNGETGDIELELADSWGAKIIPVEPNEGSSLILAYDAPAGETPNQGRLTAFCVQSLNPPRAIATFDNATVIRLEPGNAGANDVFIREVSKDAAVVLHHFRWNGKELRQVREFRNELVANDKLRVVLPDARGENVMVWTTASGDMIVTAPNGGVRSRVGLKSANLPTLAGADLNDDGRAELVVQSLFGPLCVYSFANDGTATVLADYVDSLPGSWRGPLAYDFDGDGRAELARLARGDDGRVRVTAERIGSTPLFTTGLDLSADDVDEYVLHAGEFLAPDQAGLSVSITDSRRIREGTTLLAGRTGAVQWSKSRYYDGAIVMPYYPRGIPTAVDINGDGIEEIGLDLLSYMAFLHGKDGEFALIRHTKNIRVEGATYAGHLYNTFCPVFDTPKADRPHWFVFGGYGSFGLMKPDAVDGIWKTDLGYDVPPKLGLVDVDGDGRLEVGYAPLGQKNFICRDLWSGDVEWELELPYSPSAPTFSADVDGDGKGEFLTAGFCIGTDAMGKGVLRWQAPANLSWCVIADFDGNGEGEIACPTAGGVTILRSLSPKPATAH